MMNKLIKALIFSISVVLLVYVVPTSPDFPKPPSDFVQSMEPGDVETPLRRGYFTNLGRDEVINHYEKEFNRGFTVYNQRFDVYTPRLNYPPEEAPALIRDQTKSTFLEEIVHPFRESIYINGFEPKSEEYAQFYKGVRYNQKIIIRYIPSELWIRVVAVIGSMLSFYFLFKEYQYAKK